MYTMFFFIIIFILSISRRETRSEMARKTGLKRIGHALRSSRESGVMWVTLLLLLLLYNKRNPPVIAGRVALKNNYPTFRRQRKFAANDLLYFLSIFVIFYRKNKNCLRKFIATHLCQKRISSSLGKIDVFITPYVPSKEKSNLKHVYGGIK